MIALLAALALQTMPVFAQTAKPPPSASPAPSISADVTADDDARITARIRGIFSEISALRPVQVRVSAGVVTLTGTVDNVAAIDQAAGIAQRVTGVVTVQNRLQRNLQVENNLNPALAGVHDKATELVRLAPLVGVAIVIALLVGSLGYFIARRRKLLLRIAPNPFLAEVMATAIRFTFVIAGIVLALDIVGATALLGAVLGGAGVIGIALGFAVRDTIDNYVSSLMLSLRQPFRANDKVSIDDKEGRVLRLTSRATILITADGNHLRIPNSAVFRAVIVNFSSNPQRRVQFDLPFDIHADPACSVEAVLNSIRAQDFVLKTPEPKVELVDMAAGPNPVLRGFGWIDQTNTDPGKARTVLMQAAACALRDGGYGVADALYHVKIDGDESAAAKPAPAAAPSPPPATQDVAAEDHIAVMVEKERSKKSDGKDLLDSSRPVE